MPLIETEGLILKSYVLSESDKIVVSFTRQRGMIKAVARSARKLKSRFSGRLEPFTIAELVFYEKDERELVSIRQADINYSKFHLIGDLEVFTTLSYLSELLLEFLPAGEPNETLFRMAKSVFVAIDRNYSANKLITLYFEIWLLRLSGYLPDWRVCAECHRRNSVKDSLVFDAGFRFYCLACRQNKNNILHKKDLGLLSLTHKLGPLEFAAKLSEDKYEDGNLSELTHRIIRRTLERDPKIWTFGMS